jgi:hypothetical protein
MLLSRCQTSPLSNGLWTMEPMAGSISYHSAVAESLAAAPTSKDLSSPFISHVFMQLLVGAIVSVCYPVPR